MDGSSSSGDGREGTEPRGDRRRVRTPPAGLELPVERVGTLLDGNGPRHRDGDGGCFGPGNQTPGGGGEAGRGYVSLRDLLPSPSSPSPAACPAGAHDCEISIRNRLVKQAAHAYLQPMAASPSPRPSQGRGSFQLSCYHDDDGGCVGFVGEWLIPATRAALGRLVARLRWREEGPER